MKISELRQLDPSGLQNALLNLLQENSKLTMQHRTNRLKTTHKLRDVRRSIARLHMLLSQKASNNE